MSSARAELRVEFFGIPRLRAGVSETVIDLSEEQRIAFESVVAVLAGRFPALSRECFADGGMRDGFAANVNGKRFVGRPDDSLQAGETLLLFSADAGG